ncbi:menaquinone biosynthesis protein [Agriterribacter sp.]|uniref:menaquinone biosynthetic enzyme MqnA/MqnD family protein n=1 Tax=Agriterribacter sp. TaxID=2821509 RepID=UPI002C72994F|nr:menaquinone biosynthesis protein [Agriterribacter sp.]HRP55711.1 menaquinone biosynthesis protein [Agriterribacter sp.]
MRNKISVGIIDYLNVKPFLYGIKHSSVIEDIDLVETYPSSLAQMLLAGEVDLGIVPVAIIPEMKEYYMVTDYCIGCNGPVATVCLFSEVPVNRIERVLLDYQSKTSVALAKILLQKYWRVSPSFEDAKEEGFRSRISGTTAGVVIGDRAFDQRTRSTYRYDLGEAWKDFTGLPFVFAAWIANKPLPDGFIHAFNEANAFGLMHIDEVVQENPYKLFDLKQYYKYNVNYVLDENKKAGLDAFLRLLETAKPRVI